MLARFEATTGDVIAAAGANVVKRIGDAVMFVTNAPGVACALALELIEACTRERLPKLRVGLAVGDVIVRQGDFYGPTVNLAARLVASAEPGTALADARAARPARRACAAGYGFAAAGKFQLPGFDEPVEVFQLLRYPNPSSSVRASGSVASHRAIRGGQWRVRSARGGARPRLRTARRAGRGGRRSSRGPARPRARSCTGPASACGAEHAQRRGRPATRSTAETSAPSTRSAAPLAARTRCRAPVRARAARTGRGSASAAP